MVIWEIENMDTGQKELVGAETIQEMVDGLEEKGFNVIEGAESEKGKPLKKTYMAVGFNEGGQEISAMEATVFNVSLLRQVDDLFCKKD